MLQLKYSIHVIRKIEKKEGIFTAVNTSLASLEVWITIVLSFDAGLTLETSALKSLSGDQVTLSTHLIKPKYLPESEITDDKFKRSSVQ